MRVSSLALLLFIAFVCHSGSAIECDIDGSLSLAPFSIVQSPLVLNFDGAVGASATSFRSTLRSDIASALSMDVSRVCVADVATPSGDSPAASIIFFPNFMGSSTNQSEAQLASSLETQANTPSTPFRLSSTGSHIVSADTSLTAFSLALCLNLEQYIDAGATCPADETPAPPNPDDERGSTLSILLGLGLLLLTAVVLAAFGASLSKYERQADKKQRARIEMNQRVREGVY